MRKNNFHFSIIGIGITKFGELWDKSLRQLGLETGLAAINDAKQKGEVAAEEEMKNLTGGLPLPPGMKLPF